MYFAKITRAYAIEQNMSRNICAGNDAMKIAER
jgi:hypothetical protein